MTGPLRVLIVEDSPTDAKLMARELHRLDRDVHFERVETVEAMRAALRKQEWDAIISDWSLPKFSAMEALNCVKELALDVPFIVVSGTVGEETVVEAMRAGAHDYVLKDKLTRLLPAIEREIAQRQGREAGRRTQDALRSSETRFIRLWESGIVGISIGVFLGAVHDANDAFLRTVGRSRSELQLGKVQWDAMTPPEWKRADEAAVQLLQSQGFAPAWEKELIRKDGERVPVLVGAAMLDYPMCIAVMTDLTERKRVEQALLASENQLRLAQKMEAIGSLAGGVAHDFNNILSVILSYAGMLLGDLVPDDPMREGLEEIRQAGQRAAALTRQLLLFSRHQAFEPVVLSLNDVLAGMDKLIRRILGEDVEVVLHQGASLSRIFADASHIEQVIMNLVVNARDAMPTGGKLTLETKNVLLDESFAERHLGVVPGPYVLLTVTDTGGGMDKETQLRIFEPFFTTKEVGKGTGLGLSTVFGIVRQSEGSIWVESAPGAGTTFSVYFPQSEREPEKVRKAIAPPVLTGTETILLIEDEEHVRVVSRAILARNGYNVVEVGSPSEAVEVCSKPSSPIHLVLTDVVMPQMSGPELAKRLRSLRPEIKVLFMSGYTDDTIIRHGMLDPKTRFLQKPLTPEDLLRKVREVLDGGR
jgi:two-component system, cell cycle sensor histidine kinase and response regulator CckA